MPSIYPFRAVLYADTQGPDVTAFVAPPYDVIGPAMRARLASEPHSVVEIDLPAGTDDPADPASRYARASKLWRQWLTEGVLVQDATPAIYVLEQTWQHAGRTVRRRAFIAAVRLHAFDEGIILPHERTLPKAVTDRLNLTRACQANMSPVFGLFPDPEGDSDVLFESASRAPLLRAARDEEGVTSELRALRGPDTIARLQACLADRQVFIADGHHRYTTALAYRDEQRAAAGAAEPDAPHESVLMALVNMDDPDLVVLPTHRVARATEAFSPAAFWEGLSRHFTLTEVGPAESPLRAGGQPEFIVRTSDGTTRIARLRQDLDAADLIATDASAAWKRLDVAVAQELVLRPLLGIDVDDARTLDRLRFPKSADEALQLPGGADVAIIMRATRMDQLREVALGGERMPQKSTYFYPKLLTGLYFRSLA